MKAWQKILTVLVLLAVFTGTAFAAEFNWTFQSSGAAGDDVFGLETTWAKEIAEESKGRIQVTMLPADSVVKYTETLDAVGANIIQGDFTDPSYFAGKDPAFSLVGNMVGA